MDHFDNGPFNRSHFATSEILKVHRHSLTESERAVIQHCQAMISTIANVARIRHYEEQSFTDGPGEEASPCL